jgi:DNA-directed RNA polymerase specialized sigma24 family protein
MANLAPGATEADLEQYRPQLTGYCYRMMGSAFEAEDAVQETMIRAWRHLDQFEGRAARKSWLYRIATRREPSQPMPVPRYHARSCSAPRSHSS